MNERKEPGWEFMFLAAGQNAIDVGQHYGFDKDSTVTFANSGQGAHHATAVASGYTSTLRSYGKKSAMGMKTEYINANASALSEVGNIGDVVDSAVPDVSGVAPAVDAFMAKEGGKFADAVNTAFEKAKDSDVPDISGVTDLKDITT